MRIVFGLVLATLLAFGTGCLLHMVGVPAAAVYIITAIVGLLGGATIPAAFRAL